MGGEGTPGRGMVSVRVEGFLPTIWPGLMAVGAVNSLSERKRSVCSGGGHGCGSYDESGLGGDVLDGFGVLFIEFLD